MQVDEIRNELSSLTDICAELFQTVSETRPDDEHIESLFTQYEAVLHNVSCLLDAVSERAHRNALPFTPVKGRDRPRVMAPYDKESLMVYLNRYPLLTAETPRTR